VTAGQQRRTLAVSAMTVFALGFLNAANKDEMPNARFLIGIGFTYTIISMIADLGAGDFAAGMAILIMISAILYEGEDIINLLNRRSKGEVKPAKGKKRKGGQLIAAEGLEALEEAESPGEHLTPMQKMQRLQRSQRLSRR